jgi:hypothetical protein
LESISISPNPNDGIFTVTRNKAVDTQINNAEILDLLTGRVINIPYNQNGTFTVDIVGEPGGNYAIRLTTNHSVISKPFIKN